MKPSTSLLRRLWRALLWVERLSGNNSGGMYVARMSNVHRPLRVTLTACTLTERQAVRLLVLLRKLFPPNGQAAAAVFATVRDLLVGGSTTNGGNTLLLSSRRRRGYGGLLSNLRRGVFSLANGCRGACGGGCQWLTASMCNMCPIPARPTLRGCKSARRSGPVPAVRR